MKTVVITGSTRGIGFGMADSMLQRGANVVITGRQQASVDAAVDQLRQRHPAERILGVACDVGDYNQVQALWDTAKDRFGRIDIWINNAALNTPAQNLWENTPEALAQTVNANLMGAIYGCKVAIQGMIAQGGGHVYNVRGLGSKGEIQYGSTPYGLTKRAVEYLTLALKRELKDQPVKISTYSPGIVPTELLYNSIAPHRQAQARRFLNIVADRVETVAPWLAEQVLANEKDGANIEWMPMTRMIGRFLTAPLRKRDVMS